MVSSDFRNLIIFKTYLCMSKLTFKKHWLSLSYRFSRGTLIHRGAQLREIVLIFKVSHQGTLVPHVGGISTEQGWPPLCGDGNHHCYWGNGNPLSRIQKFLVLLQLHHERGHLETVPPTCSHYSIYMPHLPTQQLVPKSVLPVL